MVGQETVKMVLYEIYLERGPVEDVLMDNGAAFRPRALKDMFDGWNVSRYFKAACRPSGNGIVDRYQWTIKAMAERWHVTLMEAVF